jgi:hypothetical protein
MATDIDLDVVMQSAALSRRQMEGALAGWFKAAA